MSNTVSNKVMESFKKDFFAIKGKEFKSNRKNSTGIGKTFEDLIGVEENNNLLVDYKGEIELKSQREYTKSRLTLFTKSPSSSKSTISTLTNTYGSNDSVYPKIKVLHTTIKCSDFNTFAGKYGFKLEIDKATKRLYVLVKDLATNLIIDRNTYWDLNEIKAKVETKCKNIAYITAKTVKKNDDEYFSFQKAVLLSGLTYKAFLKHLENDTIVFEIRKGVYKSGKKAGQIHDHGAAFRIAKRDIEKVFIKEEIK